MRSGENGGGRGDLWGVQNVRDLRGVGQEEEEESGQEEEEEGGGEGSQAARDLLLSQKLCKLVFLLFFIGVHSGKLAATTVLQFKEKGWLREEEETLFF